MFLVTTNEKGYGNIDFYLLGKNIVEMREKQKMTQIQLASKIGVNPKTVSNWETAKKRPRLHDILMLCDAFQCDLDYLLGRKQFENKKIEIACEYTGLSKKTVRKLHHASLQKEDPEYLDNTKLNVLLSDLLDNYKSFNDFMELLDSYMVDGALLYHIKKSPNRRSVVAHEYELQCKASTDAGFIKLMHYLEKIKESCYKDDYVLKRLSSNPMMRSFINNPSQDPKA